MSDLSYQLYLILNQSVQTNTINNTCHGQVSLSVMTIICYLYIGPGSYQERPPHYLDSSDQPPYDQEPPGQYYDDRMGPPSMNGPPSRDAYPEDGQRTPSVNGGSKFVRQSISAWQNSCPDNDWHGILTGVLLLMSLSAKNVLHWKRLRWEILVPVEIYKYSCNSVQYLENFITAYHQLSP